MDDAVLEELWFPQLDDVVVQRLDAGGEFVVVKGRCRVPWRACPDCAALASRVHSRYVRRVTDDAVGGRPLIIELRVRRFRCLNSACERRTFAEQVPGLTFRHGRRSSRLQSVLRTLALLLAGRAGARLAKAMAVRISRSTLLRLIRALPDPAAVTPKVLGVDEFALRKGRVYGTILVGIATRRPVELLPDARADTLAAWLRAHPGVEVICRGPGRRLRRRRSHRGAGCRAGRRSRHLWHNLAEAVERTVVRHRSQLREPPPSPPQPRRETQFAELTSSGNQEGRFADRTRERHADVHRLMDHGHGLREISRQLGLSRTTVRRFANAVTAEELLAGRWAGLPSILDPHKPYLHQRVQDGCTTSSVLLTELRGRGYRGGVTIVRR